MTPEVSNTLIRCIGYMAQLYQRVIAPSHEIFASVRRIADPAFANLSDSYENYFYTRSISARTFRIATGSSIMGNLKIPLKQLEQNPGQLLCSLYKNDFSSLKITFVGDFGQELPGIDAGALRLEFLHKVLHGVIAEQNGPLHFENNMPVSKENILSQEEVQGYFVIGRLLGLCLYKAELRTGVHFPLKFFTAISQISAKEATVGFSYASALAVFEALAPEYKEAIRCITSTNLEADGLKEVALNWAFPEGGGATLCDGTIQEKIVENLQVKERVEPFFPIVAGIVRSCPDWDAVRSEGIVDLSQRIQGVAVLREDIIVLGTASTAHTFFLRWLDEATDSQRELFVSVATGSNTKAEGGSVTLIVDTYNNPKQYGSVEFHACGGTVMFSTYPDYETFKYSLEMSLAVFRNGGFTFS